VLRQSERFDLRFEERVMLTNCRPHTATTLAIVAAVIQFLAPSARAQEQGDWLDEMPAVTDIAHAALAELKDTHSNRPDVFNDEDRIAVSLVRAFTLLRQMMFLKYNAEPPMSQQREAKLKAIYAAYSEAELVIGQGAPARRGYITRGPDTGRGCRAGDRECYLRWFKNDAFIGGARYRERMFRRLFPCGDRAKELIDLHQRHASDAPYMPSPAVTGEVEPEVAGIAPAGCGAFGGDAKGNGLCADWRNAPPAGCPAVARDNQPEFEGGETRADNRWVQVKTGVNARQGDRCEEGVIKIRDCDHQVRMAKTRSGGCEMENGISIRVKCASGHVVQFISREYWKRGTPDSQTADHNLESGEYGAAPYTPDKDDPDIKVLACYAKTRNLKDRQWRTDSPKKKNPYYESTMSYATTCNSMTVFDAPNVSAFDASKYLVIRIIAKSFVICGCKVVAVVDWQREYFAGAPDKPVYTVKPPREPLLGEVEEFQARSRQEGFAPWPPAEEECAKCAP
jgi:hypothetical protein